MGEWENLCVANKISSKQQFFVKQKKKKNPWPCKLKQ